MSFAAAHIDYVLASYAVTAIAFAALAVAILRRDRRLKRELTRLETGASREQ
jgi:heme exporter protein CcmD